MTYQWENSQIFPSRPSTKVCQGKTWRLKCGPRGFSKPWRGMERLRESFGILIVVPASYLFRSTVWRSSVTWGSFLRSDSEGNLDKFSDESFKLKLLFLSHPPCWVTIRIRWMMQPWFCCQHTWRCYPFSIKSHRVGLTKQAICPFECYKRRKRQVDWVGDQCPKFDETTENLKFQLKDEKEKLGTISSRDYETNWRIEVCHSSVATWSYSNLIGKQGTFKYLCRSLVEQFNILWTWSLIALNSNFSRCPS